MADTPEDEIKAFSDDYADFITYHTLDLLKLSNAVKADIYKKLAGIEEALIAALLALFKDRDGGLTKTGLNKILRENQDVVETTYGEIAADTEKTVRDVIELEIAANVYFVNESASAPVFTTIPKDDLKKILDSFYIKGLSLDDWWNRQAQAVQDRVADQMRAGYLNGDSIEDLLTRVRGTRQSAYNDGIMQGAKDGVDMLAKTSVLGAANEGRIELFKFNRDVIKGIQWLAILDGRTCPRCAALDGAQWDNELNPIGHKKSFPGNTLHPRCRCTTISILKSFKELDTEDAVTGPRGGKGAMTDHISKYAGKAGWSAVEEENQIGRLRRTMKGEPATTLNFEQWLKGKPESFQDEVLGIGRAKIWRDKKLTLQQLTNADNRQLTIEQLRAKYTP